ncbi:MAG: C39 family peptidase [Thermodesulfobacteriota bacterium]
MHILIAFLITVSLIAGFTPEKDPVEKETRLFIGYDGGIVPQASIPVEIRTRVEPASEQEYRHVIRQQFDYSCGSAALATLLRYQLGEDLNETQVIHGLFRYGDKEKVREKRAFSLLDMKRFVGALGYNGVGYKADIKDLEALHMPCIVPIELYGYRHFTVFKGTHQGHVFLADPFRGNSSYPAADFEKMWHQNVIFVVYPKGAHQLALLGLSENDLRFVDADTRFDMIFNNLPPQEGRPPEPFPSQIQYYKR